MSDRQRLFFALWPDESLRDAIAPLLTLHRECGGRPHPPTNLHVTLNFPGMVDGETRDCLERAAGEICAPPFELTLDHFGYWPKPEVMWLGCSAVPSPLAQLVERLNGAMRDCGLIPESRLYRPHLTLLRKARQSPQGEPPAFHWQAREFVLVESVSTPTGVEYRVLRRWPLTG